MWIGNGCPPSDRLALCQAYIAKEIREMSERLGHVAIIDHNPRRGEQIEFSPAEALRYHERSAAEQMLRMLG